MSQKGKNTTEAHSQKYIKVCDPTSKCQYLASRALSIQKRITVEQTDQKTAKPKPKSKSINRKIGKNSYSHIHKNEHDVCPNPDYSDG